MTNEQQESMHKAVAWLNTILLGVVVFFLLRLIAQFDNIAENVTGIREEIAVIKYNVARHEKEIDKIQNLKNN